MQGKHSNRAGRIWVTMTLVILAGALVGGAAGLFVANMSKKTHTTPGQMVTPPFGGQKLIYVLALGEDNTWTKNKDVHGRSDTIMVAAIDLDKNDVRAISIPRDTRCVIPGRDGYDKINAAYTFGGPELSRQTVGMLLGISIPYYIKTNIDGLKDTVDLLGGVEIDIEKDMHYRDRRGGLNINLKKGYRHLDGDKALQYVRFRHDTFGDITRIQRQQKFLRAIARRMLAKENVGKLTTVIDEIMRNVDTNMSGKDLLYLARLSRKVQPEDVKMETLPGVPENIKGISYWIADDVKMRNMVDQLLKFQDPVAAMPTAPAGPLPTIEVLNGGGQPGSATRVSDMLKKSGYQVISVGNVPNFGYDQSELRSRIGDNDRVKRVAALLNSPRITEMPKQDTTEADITIVVGRDSHL
jgi:polyisoprenyl-teichoic acid--peptidoglycan teichoic acid transferase